MNEEILPSEMMKAGECTLPDGTAMKYRLFVPECEEEVPVVVYLHGSGFRGSDNLIQIDNGYIRHFLSDEKCIVFAPQCPSGKTWMGTENIGVPQDRLFYYNSLGESPNCAFLKEFTDGIAEKYNGDKCRIYLIGRSMGAHTIWRLMQMYPEWSAANVSVAGGADLSYAEIYKDKNIWMFQGSDDTIVPSTTAEKIYLTLVNMGSDKIRLNMYQGADHMSVDEYASKNDEMYKWMFSQRNLSGGGK